MVTLTERRPKERSTQAAALSATRARLLASSTADGPWHGRLSSSALSTATAVCALELKARSGRPVGEELLSDRAGQGAEWLILNQNPDGGWGDTVESPSNLSTTILCWSALGLCLPRLPQARSAFELAEGWLRRRVGELTPESIGEAIAARYGSDRTFSTPILTLCAATGRLGEAPSAWAPIPHLPFELSVLPNRFFRFLGLPMVSYALPALIAIGQAIFHHRGGGNPAVRWLRSKASAPSLRLLERIQPAGGGFLEAIPLTSFVVLSLVSIGAEDHPVVQRGIGFLLDSIRSDGSWPIDTNLATWLTTLSVNALSIDSSLRDQLDDVQRRRLNRWLLDQQYREGHFYTGSAAGGWAWTDLSGGVPDADDTAGALLALDALACAEPDLRSGNAHAARLGVDWLLGLQNRDGGVPTFCRGWGQLPFDRSSPDITAHALRAWGTWLPHLPDQMRRRVRRSTDEGVRFLLKTQRDDGAWVPLWFGNQLEASQQNPVYGTSRVLTAAAALTPKSTYHARWRRAMAKAQKWLLSVQNRDGGWGAGPGTPSTIEETAQAVDGVASLAQTVPNTLSPNTRGALAEGCRWLMRETDSGRRFEAAPIGLYFEKLWYHESLYPIIFTLAALARCSDLGLGECPSEEAAKDASRDASHAEPLCDDGRLAVNEAP